MSRIASLCFCGMLAACSDGPATPDFGAIAAEVFIRRDQSPRPVKIVAIWPAGAGGLQCGEIEPPAALRERRSPVRFVYDTANRFGQVEHHEGWRGGNVGTAALLAENRVIFDAMWADHCQPAAPLRRRLAGWLSGWSGAERGETPITSTYTDRLLRGTGER